MAKVWPITRGGKTVAIAFICPACKHGHAAALVADFFPSGSVWGYNGNADAPTFTPSLKIEGKDADGRNAVCHSVVTDGRIAFDADSTHALVGQTVDLPEL